RPMPIRICSLVLSNRCRSLETNRRSGKKCGTKSWPFANPCRRLSTYPGATVIPRLGARILMVEKRFEAVNQEVSELIGINRQESDQSVDQIHSIQRRTLAFSGAMTLIGVLLAVSAAVRATRIIRTRDDEIARGALLLEAHNRELDAFAGRVAHDL